MALMLHSLIIKFDREDSISWFLFHNVRNLVSRSDVNCILLSMEGCFRVSVISLRYFKVITETDKLMLYRI